MARRDSAAGAGAGRAVAPTVQTDARLARIRGDLIPRAPILPLSHVGRNALSRAFGVLRTIRDSNARNAAASKLHDVVSKDAEAYQRVHKTHRIAVVSVKTVIALLNNRAGGCMCQQGENGAPFARQCNDCARVLSDQVRCWASFTAQCSQLIPETTRTKPLVVVGFIPKVNPLMKLVNKAMDTVSADICVMHALKALLGYAEIVTLVAGIRHQKSLAVTLGLFTSVGDAGAEEDAWADDGFALTRPEQQIMFARQTHALAVFRSVSRRVTRLRMRVHQALVVFIARREAVRLGKTLSLEQAANFLVAVVSTVFAVTHTAPCFSSTYWATHRPSATSGVKACEGSPPGDTEDMEWEWSAHNALKQCIRPSHPGFGSEARSPDTTGMSSTVIAPMVAIRVAPYIWEVARAPAKLLPVMYELRTRPDLDGFTK